MDSQLVAARPRMTATGAGHVMVVADDLTGANATAAGLARARNPGGRP